ncbi:hypothetical protein PND19_01160 [Ligilactobacillus ruminis]|uniref:DUF4352 domain-containing protein n=1 Tax=Ligilactobacillus ruminis TaxID=1623 RepID=UPI00232FE9DC|nr:DUF4352 domain-containing protein [Ligilactobacillus ruminis]MDB7641246.1 hypothetical protein [Ligilactobacillus ruminis]MDB7646160.1 hypothetical protein [Ligilactobacillus ruminis]
MSEKKKFYKKPVFWIIVVVIVAIVGIAAHKIKQEQEAREARALVSSLVKEDNSKDDDDDYDDYDDDDDDDVDDDDSDSDETYHKVGESAKVDGVTYTLKSVELTDERNEFEDKQPKYVVKVIYHIKNETGDEITIGNDSDVYDPDDTKLEEYAIDGTGLDSLADGKEADVTVGYSADKLGTFELQFCPIDDDAEPVKFTADVQ